MTVPMPASASTPVVAPAPTPVPTPLVVHIPAAMKPMVVRPNKPTMESSQPDNENPESKLSSDEQSDN